MAHIPVEHKTGGGGWWKWLLALLVVGLAIWAIAEIVDTDPVEDIAVVEEVEPMTPMEPAEPVDAGLITELATITGATDWRSMLGRDVRIDDLQVTRVPGDSTFFVSSSATGATNESVMVVLDEEIPSDPPSIEGRYDVTEGQTVDILGGELQELTQKNIADWGLTPDEQQILNDRNYYIRAQRLNINS